MNESREERENAVKRIFFRNNVEQNGLAVSFYHFTVKSNVILFY